MLLFVVMLKDVTYPPPSAKEQTISLNLSKFITPSSPKPMPTIFPISKLVKKVTLPTPIAKIKILDEKSHFIVKKQKNEENNITKTISITEKKISKKRFKKVVKKRQEKRVLKRTKVRKKSKDPLANILMNSGTSIYRTRQASSSNGYEKKVIRQLYGKEFDTFTQTQKRFIEHNLGRIHRITQRTLTRHGYPDIAVRTRQEGINVVSFYLHPNGNITNLRLKRRMGYTALDKNSLEVIRIAYKDYPRPKTRTKIIFYVKYSIY